MFNLKSSKKQTKVSKPERFFKTNAKSSSIDTEATKNELTYLVVYSLCELVRQTCWRVCAVLCLRNDTKNVSGYKRTTWQLQLYIFSPPLIAMNVVSRPIADIL